MSTEALVLGCLFVAIFAVAVPAWLLNWTDERHPR